MEDVLETFHFLFDKNHSKVLFISHETHYADNASQYEVALCCII